MLDNNSFTQSEDYAMRMQQEVDIFVVSDPDCEEVHNEKPHPSNICAGVPEGGKGQCTVIILSFLYNSILHNLKTKCDSGGPLYVNGQQVGIVSWSVKPCTVAPYPGVFTEVSWYVDWINSYIN